VELDEVGQGFVGWSWDTFRFGGCWFGVEDVDEEVAVFDAYHDRSSFGKIGETSRTQITGQTPSFVRCLLRP
jgi:hypothetical protein